MSVLLACQTIYGIYYTQNVNKLSVGIKHDLVYERT